MKIITAVFSFLLISAIYSVTSANMINIKTSRDGTLTLKLVDGHAVLNGTQQEVFAPDTPYSFDKTKFDNFIKNHPEAMVEGYSSVGSVKMVPYKPSLTLDIE